MASARLRRLNPTQSPTLPPNWAKNIFSYFIQSSKRLFYQQDQPIHKGVLLNTLLLRGFWRRCEPKRNEIIYSPLCCIIRKMKCTNVYIPKILPLHTRRIQSPFPCYFEIFLVYKFIGYWAGSCIALACHCVLQKVIVDVAKRCWGDLLKTIGLSWNSQIWVIISCE